MSSGDRDKGRSIFTPNEVRLMLEDAAIRLGSRRKLADVIDCSPSFLDDVIAGAREPGEKCLAWLGMQKRTEYVLQRRVATLPLDAQIAVRRARNFKL